MAHIKRANKHMRNGKRKAVPFISTGFTHDEIPLEEQMWYIKYPNSTFKGIYDDFTIGRTDIDNWELAKYIESVKRYGRYAVRRYRF